VTTPAPVETDNNVDEADDDIPLAALKLSRELFGVEFRKLRMMDENISTCEQTDIDWEKPASDLLGIFKDDDDTCSENEDTETEGQGTDPLTH
jgi:hypothetical protein